MKSIISRGILLCIFFLVVFVWYIIPDTFFVEYSDASIIAEREKQQEIKKETVVAEASAPDVEQKEAEIKESVKQSVPFTAQAPHAQWDDPRFQDACEEASMLMAHAWVIGEGSISKNDAENELESLFSYENKNFGGSIDTSAVDTAKIFQEYYHYPAQLRTGVTMEDIYAILAQGSIVIAPTNGKMLDNPNFTDGGPDRHMVVIIGYDKKNKEFITNDPGTRLGRGYKYKDSVLYNAIRDYVTGEKEKISGASKNVIVIKK
jgi:uncharacterized protein YvpB